MISEASIARLSENLRRLQSGDADGEVVRWLRAAAPGAAGVPLPLARDKERGYTRSLVHMGDGFEIVLLHWRAGCSTPIHDHGGSLCWFAVVDGVMQVDNYVRHDNGDDPSFARIALEGHERLSAGGIDYRNDDTHLHRCVTHESPATTLHLYARPIEQFHAFDERTFAVSDVVSSYDAIL